MSTPLKNKTKSEFDKIFAHETNEEKYKHEAKLIHFMFMSAIEKLMDNQDLRKNELAERTRKSASYITQLFRGTRNINLEMLARIKEVLDFKIELKLIPENDKAGVIRYLKDDFHSSRRKLKRNQFSKYSSETSENFGQSQLAESIINSIDKNEPEVNKAS